MNKSYSLNILQSPTLRKQAPTEAQVLKECRKMHRRRQYLCNDNKENDENRPCSNHVIDLSKKIKKHHQTKVLFRRTPNSTGDKPTVYLDSELSLGLFGDMLVPQRLDNDADTDDEQIKNGVKKLFGSLKEACDLNKDGQN